MASIFKRARSSSEDEDEETYTTYPFQYNWDMGKVAKMMENCKREVGNLEAKIESDLVTIMCLQKQVTEYKEIIEILCNNKKSIEATITGKPKMESLFVKKVICKPSGQTSREGVKTDVV